MSHLPDPSDRSDTGRPPRPGRTRGDGGSLLPLSVFLLVVALAFTAFAVDMGLVYNERRQEQTAADVAALAATQEAETDYAAIFDTVFTTVNESSNGTYEPADWEDEANCPSDADLPDVDGVPFQPLATRGGTDRRPLGNAAGVTDTNCVAVWGSGYDFRVFVQTPEREVRAHFAQIVGFDHFDVDAFAIAGWGDLVDSGPVLPSPLSSSSGDAGTVCMKQPPGGHTNLVCPDGNAGGEFRYLVISRPTSTTGYACNGGHPGTIRENLAQGTDHEVGRRDETGGSWDPVAREGSGYNCPSIPSGYVANHLTTETGNIAGAVEDGLVLGTTVDGIDVPARLQRAPAVAGWPVLDFEGRTLDNSAPWDFIDPDLSFDDSPADPNGAPSVCADIADPTVAPDWTDVVTGTPVWNSTSQFLDCVEQYDAGGYTSCLFCKDTVFTGDDDPDDQIYDIMLSPRFVFVPEAHEKLYDEDPDVDEHPPLEPGGQAEENDGICESSADPETPGYDDPEVETGPQGNVQPGCDFNIQRLRPAFVDTLMYDGGPRPCWWPAGEDPKWAKTSTATTLELTSCGGPAFDSTGSLHSYSVFYFDDDDDECADPGSGPIPCPGDMLPGPARAPFVQALNATPTLLR